jgi:hypothetical protein
MMATDKEVIGLREKITIYTPHGKFDVIARIDTGATKSSIDADFAKKIGVGPAVRTAMVRSAHGSKLRPVVKIVVGIGNKLVRKEFTVAERQHMRYRVLIGLNILKKNFLIDPSKVEE